MKEKKIGILDISFLTLFVLCLCYIFIILSENAKLLRQVDEKDAIINQINTEYSNLSEVYEDLKSKYEYAVDVIRSTDKYQTAKGFEEEN